MRIVVVDDNTDFLKIMREYLSRIEGFDVVGTANNGLEACAVIQEKQPDIVLMDIAMPRLGGIGVLERLQHLVMTQKPQFIMITALGQERVSRLAVELGADFFMIKPIDLGELVLNMKHIYSLKHFRDIKTVLPEAPETMAEDKECRIRALLDSIGVPSHLKGYGYIVCAMSIIVNDLAVINAINKQVYTRVSHQFATTPARVERVIRNAVELTWSRGRLEALDKMFGFDEKGLKTKPSNTEFFVKLASEYLGRGNRRK